ncbi:hypothetical protein RI129_010904 [Pyrocoelia pectoralis]|uniref:Farnesyl diphosphate synthase n=1 Tax=Pyrocoelia pectoralis TaxID=417401 RepID=A0AAN7V486_9COLE
MFLTTFSDLVKEVKNNERYINNLELAERHVKLLEYNVPRGKLIYPLTMVAFYKLIEDPHKLTQENVQLSMVLAWCTQMLFTCFIISDDIIDSSEIRQGLPCWHLLENVGIQAINDKILLENGIHTILKRHLENHHSYVPAIELFHKLSTVLTLGQTLDALSYKNGVIDFDTFNIDFYRLISKYKTCSLFVFPIRLASHFSSQCDNKFHEWAERFFQRMGHYFHIQNDFFDCFGDPLITGKNGTDIQEGRCTWLITNAMQRASSKQKIILRQNYGKSNPQSIAAVRTIYEELDLPKLYASTEDDTYNTLQSDIQMLPQTSRGFFDQFLDRIHRRTGQTY